MVRKKKNEELKPKKEKKSEEPKRSVLTISMGSGIKLFIVGLIIGLGLGLAFVFSIPLSQSTGALSPEEAGQKAMNFISENLLPSGITAKLVKVEPVEGQDLYKLSINVSNGEISQEVESYITKDGNLLFPQGIPMEKPLNVESNNSNQESNSQEQTQNIPKSEKPEVKLFIMSHCPYGLQALKAFLPVYNLLKDKADMQVRFVDYIMHGKKELDDNMRIYCIEKEQKDKLYSYLSCYVRNGDWQSCLDEANVDKAKMEACINETDKKYNITAMYNDRSTWLSGAFPQFPIDRDLNQKYGVRGSPTVVINGKVVYPTRSPEGFKEAICSAFNTAPKECEQTLSTSTASPGFGTNAGSSSGGTCG